MSAMPNTKRTTLTKSLHTITAVKNVAALHMTVTGGNAKKAVDMALKTLDQPGPWAKDDPTYLACIAAVKKA